jgi:hypothetical protein
MQTLDDAWNAKDWDTFMACHSESVEVSWSGGSFMGPDGRITPATVAHWKNSEIVEEKLFYDLVDLLKQLGVTLTTKAQTEKVPAV